MFCEAVVHCEAALLWDPDNPKAHIRPSPSCLEDSFIGHFINEYMPRLTSAQFPLAVEFANLGVWDSLQPRAGLVHVGCSYPSCASRRSCVDILLTPRDTHDLPPRLATALTELEQYAKAPSACHHLLTRGSYFWSPCSFSFSFSFQSLSVPLSTQYLQGHSSSLTMPPCPSSRLILHYALTISTMLFTMLYPHHALPP